MILNIKNNLKIICQGFTGKSATYHSKISIEYGTNIVAGVTPQKGGLIHLNIPVFNTVKEAINKTNANVCVNFVPAHLCKESLIEAIDAGIKLIICITEGIPIHDMIHIKKIAKENNVNIIGPNSPGVVIPEVCRLGIMPSNIHKSGIIAIMSRSGTLTYEAISQTSKVELGQSISIGVGGDPIIGTTFTDILPYLEQDDNTKAILMIGEIGGNLEEKASDFIKKYIKKPVFAYISGLHAPFGKKMGHAGAIINKETESAKSKINYLIKNEIKIITDVSKIGENIKKEINI
ncbi:MAG TPA: succinate--CoA ligase subunit alpha [Candidatus Azoamicus sp.]